MRTPNPIEKLISEWPTRQAFADAVGARVEVVHKWAKTGRIPSGWQAQVVKAAAAASIEYATATWMIDVHDAAPCAPEPQKDVA